MQIYTEVVLNSEADTQGETVLYITKVIIQQKLFEVINFHKINM